MIKRFAKVEDGIFRGAAPSIQDVVDLKEKYGINRIISLDAIAADKISRSCKLLNIEHVIIPFQCKNFEMAAQLAKLNLIKLMESNKPTFVHCVHGKDRTGLFVALYRRQKGVSAKDAIAEADKYDFCKDLSRPVRENFVRIIESCSAPGSDDNSALDGWGGYSIMGAFDSIDTNQSNQSVYTGLNPESNGVSTHDIIPQEEWDKVDSGNNLPQVGNSNDTNGNGYSSGNGIGADNGNWSIHFAGATMRTKKAFTVQMNYDVTDAEKMRAEKSLRTFSQFKASLETFVNHLDLMHSPFSENQDNITSDQIYKNRVAMRNFRDRAEENYQAVRKIGLNCVNDMSIFMSDTQAEKIMKSFITSIDDVTNQFEHFIDLFKNLKSDDFKTNITKVMESVKKESAQLKQIIEDRIENYIKTDILSKNWMDSGDSSAVKEYNDTPYNTQLFKEREEKLLNKQDLSAEKE